MEFQELRILLAIADHGGFKNAAKVLRLTQPAVSLSIANLERKLNEKLLIRSTPVTPTPIGFELLKHARMVLDGEIQFQDQLKRLKSGHLEKITMAVDHIASNFYCPGLIKSIYADLPLAQINIRKMAARKVIERVRKGICEVGIGPFQKNMSDMEKIKIFNSESVLITYKKNASIKIYKHNPEEFLKESILLTSYLDDPDERPSRKKIRDYFKSVWQINDINLQLEVLKQGIGSTFIAKSILDQHPEKNQFKVLDKLPFSLIKKNYGFYYLKDNKDHLLIKKIGLHFLS